MADRGRPPKLRRVIRRDDSGPVTVGDHVIAKIASGNFLETAAASAGISKRTVHNWLREGARLAAEIEEGRIEVDPDSHEAALVDFSERYALAEAAWEIGSNETLDRLCMQREYEEIRTTTEGEGDEKTVRVVTVRRTLEPDAATLRWRLGHRFPERYGKSSVEISGPDGGPIPISVRESAIGQLTEMAERMAESKKQLDALTAERDETGEE